MKTKKVYKNKKRNIKANLLLFVFIISILGFIFNTGKLWLQIIDKKNEVKELAKKMDDLTHEESYLSTEVDKLNDPEYIARYAREKYLYSKDGEFTIRIK